MATVFFMGALDDSLVQAHTNLVPRGCVVVQDLPSGVFMAFLPLSTTVTVIGGRGEGRRKERN